MEYKTPLQAIVEKCLDCSVYDEEEVKLCPCKDCPLWEFRFGKNPYKKKRTITEKQRQAAAERMKKLNNKKKEIKDGE